MLRALGRRVAIGCFAGLGGAVVMDAVTTRFMRRQSRSSLRREAALQPEGTPVAAARRLARLVGVTLSDEHAARVGALLHRGSAVMGGCAIALVPTRRDPVPVAIGLAVASFVLLDEAATAFSGAAPAPHRYPVETHVRGLVGHLAYGASVGALLRGMERAVPA